jgi:aryl-alcohol dehydrogenase-like predicted oxidoreductase
LNRQPEENGVLDACRELNVALVAYRPLEGGRLKSNNVRELFPSNSPSSTDGKEEAALKERVLHETLQRIALQRGKSVSEVALNWLLETDEHVIPIPGATSDLHGLENADTLTWELSDDEFRAIDQASSPWKQYTGGERRKLLKDMVSFGVKRWFRGRS